MAIHIKKSHRGLLHKNLGVKQGQKIPASKLAVKSTDSEAVRKRKQFAINSKTWKHAEGGIVNPMEDPEYAYTQQNPKFPQGGRTPIIVNDKKDARLKAYNDSLEDFNFTIGVLNGWKSKGYKPMFSKKIDDDLGTTGSNQPIGMLRIDTPNESDRVIFYKKPVQPVIYKPKSSSTVVKNKINTSNAISLYKEAQKQPTINNIITKKYEGREFMETTGLQPVNYTQQQIDSAKAVIKKSGKKAFATGGKINVDYRIPEYGLGSTIGGVLGAGVGALGFFGGPAVGLATTQMGMQLGQNFGGQYDTPELPPSGKPVQQTYPTIKGYGNNNSIYAMGGPTYLNQGGSMLFEDGGQPSEVELNEVMRQPNGQTMIADGPSHANGGVQMNLPPGTEITSDRLKNPMTNNTFASDQGALERAKARANKVLKYRPNDKYVKKSIDLLDKASGEIFDLQEQMKQVEGTKRMFKKGGIVYAYGGNTDPLLQLNNPSSQFGFNQTNQFDANQPTNYNINEGNYISDPNQTSLSPQDIGGNSFNMGNVGLGLGLANTAMQFANTFNPESIERIRNTQMQPAIDTYQNAINRQRNLRYNVSDQLAENKNSELSTNAYINRNISNTGVRMGNRLANRALSLNNSNNIYGNANRANLGIQGQANQMQMGLAGLRGELGAQDTAYNQDYRNMNLQQKAALRKIRSSALSDLSGNFQAYGRDQELMRLLPQMFPHSIYNKKP